VVKAQTQRAEIAESGLAIIHSSPILLKSVTIARPDEFFCLIRYDRRRFFAAKL
jgi:hypothetical protein